MKRIKWSWASLTLAIVLFLPALAVEVALCPAAWTLGFAARVTLAVAVDVAQAFTNGWQASDAGNH